jgi:signal transduction histidine kinase
MPVGKGSSRRTCTMSQPNREERVIITAPVGQDAEAMAAALKREGFETQICRRLDDCSQQMVDSAGAVLFTEEALESVQASGFLDVLRTQEPWSELPLIILTSGGESRRAVLLDLAADAAGTVILLERPISTRTLMRSVQVALRSRRRQYQVRDLVRQLASLNQTLEQRVAQRTAEAVERAQKLRLLSAELSLAEERERRRIAQVLHDDLQQMLMAAQLHLRSLDKTENAARRNEIMRKMQNMLERSFKLTRSLSVELSPPVLHDHGLAAALEWLAAQARKHHGVNVSVEADPSANPKAIDVRVFLFQAVRELLLNAVKHAARSPVHIMMKGIGSGKLRVIVSDRGPGFDSSKLDRQGIQLGGLGLFSIRERMASFGGKLQIDSTPGRGTRITLIAPRG